jgi:aminopyrrolnitrin oxygenase
VELYTDVYPESWWALMPSSDLARGRAKTIDALGRTLVVFRTESGKVAAMDRFCPHMGASLAQGKVAGERIVCPFHLWEYDCEGACVRIPYLEEGAKIPPGARTPTVPVVEHLGWIWIYHGDRPAYDLPDMPELRDPSYMLSMRTQRFLIHPLVLLENACDLQHFKSIHKVDFTSQKWEVLAETRHTFEIEVTQEVPKKALILGGDIRSRFLYAGASVIFGTLDRRQRRLARFIAAPTPVGPKEIAFHLIVLVKRLPWWLRPLDPLYRRIFAWLMFKGSTDDYLPIWRHQDPARRRVLVEEDRLQQRFRAYYRSHLPGAPSDRSRPALEVLK